MNRKTLFFGAIVVALVSLILAIYYAMPGVYHVLTGGSHPPKDPQPTHIVLFVFLTVLCILVALVNRPKASRNS
ncbi:MAG TPA: hypothetical protein VKV19_07930 [Ktedonobacteraceae bacterium]|nr:hypothetical protein [Ktedonobacteraceae bacterium]